MRAKGSPNYRRAWRGRAFSHARQAGRDPRQREQRVVQRIQYGQAGPAMNPMTSVTTYFKPMGTGCIKAYGTADSTFWCCNGTGTGN